MIDWVGRVTLVTLSSHFLKSLSLINVHWWKSFFRAIVSLVTPSLPLVISSNLSLKSQITRFSHTLKPLSLVVTSHIIVSDHCIFSHFFEVLYLQSCPLVVISNHTHSRVTLSFKSLREWLERVTRESDSRETGESDSREWLDDSREWLDDSREWSRECLESLSLSNHFLKSLSQITLSNHSLKSLSQITLSNHSLKSLSLVNEHWWKTLYRVIVSLVTPSSHFLQPLSRITLSSHYLYLLPPVRASPVMSSSRHLKPLSRITPSRQSLSRSLEYERGGFD